MAEKGFNWMHYDCEFHKDRAAMLNPYAWNVYREDLYLDSQPSSVWVVNSYVPKRPTAVQVEAKPVPPGIPVVSTPEEGMDTPKDVIPKGYCYSFHSPNRRCSRNRSCTFNHLCYKCKKHPHPGFKCTVVTNWVPKSGSDKSDQKGRDNSNQK